ncbi:Periplasmic protease [Rubellimicrobium thermophilum DSM 16684]|uniref:Periplasmic protease n=1 Tax=Rubellimicrobium thermophilum DSM 16684 TaxID=1123069 RepID=S9SMA9_9RHOB|nr:Periplasmic protease [Rubellimicrobium thermophilum DSM 16684]
MDGESVLGLTLDQAVERMRGPVGSEVVLTIVREGVAEPFDVSIIRDTIKLTAVRARTEGQTVVLRITTFNEQTFPNLTEGLAQQIEAAGGLDRINGVVIDLRNNPGGLLSQAIYVADAFLDGGEIVSTRGRRPEDGERFNATPGDLIAGNPSSCSSMAARPRLRKSSPGRFRTMTGRSLSAPRASARGRCRRSCRSRAMAPCG